MLVHLHQIKKQIWTNLVQIIICNLHLVHGNFVSKNDSTNMIIIILAK